MQLIIVIAELWKQQAAAFCPSSNSCIYLFIYFSHVTVWFIALGWVGVGRWRGGC